MYFVLLSNTDRSQPRDCNVEFFIHSRLFLQAAIDINLCIKYAFVYIIDEHSEIEFDNIR